MHRVAGSFAREQAAFEELFREFFLPVRKFFAKRGCNPATSEDLAQETFLRAHRAFASFRGDAKPLTWLLTIATNVWSNHRRAASAAKRAGPESSLDEVVTEPESKDRPQDRMIAEERRRLLDSAIQGLPPKMRRCVWLRVYQNRSYRDIADLLGIKVGTAKSQVSMAKPRLRASLAEHYPDLALNREDREK